MTRTLFSILAVAATLANLPADRAFGQEAVGAYLAGRQASYTNDFEAAAEYYTRALTRDPSNPAIMENAVIAQMALGRIDLAVPIARKIEADGLRSQIAHMAMIADDVRHDRLDAVIERIEDGRGIGSLGDNLMSAWAILGEGDVQAALAKFDAVAGERGMRSFALYHKALALASVGDFGAADAIFSGTEDGPIQQTRRGTIAWAQVLSQLERNDDAVKLLDDAFGVNIDPEITALRTALLSEDTVPFSMIETPNDGIAEVFYSLGRALLSEASQDYVLVYGRMAEHLSPKHVDATMLVAELLDALTLYDLATEAYKTVPRDHPGFPAAEMGRADSLHRAGKTDAAIEVLEQLSKSLPDLPLVHVSTGDLHRQLEQYEQATTAYDRALELYGDQEGQTWFVHYARAISFERLGLWPQAEADFRKALDLNPEHPQVLNYLGYSLVEKQIKLDEALGMIERAVARQPNSGFIVDSLGWVLYRLGRYDEAIVHMERAAELMPIDPVVNDHLGDVLWAVGRFNEAEFQWKRALSFVDEEATPSDIDPDRIRRKLEVGLDVVLEEEGAAPLEAANDGG